MLTSQTKEFPYLILKRDILKMDLVFPQLSL